MVNAYLATLRRNLARALRTRDFAGAEDILLQLKREDPLSVHTRGSELELLVVAGRDDEARKLADHLVEAFPNSARVLFLAGRALYRAREYERAARLFSASGTINPHWRADLWLGKALTQAGNYQKAEAVLVDIVTESEQAYSALGWLYERMDDLDRAAENYSAFLEVRPDDDFVRRALARVRTKNTAIEDVQAEVETLVDFGEAIPAEMLPKYVERLLTTGQRRRVSELFDAIEADLDSRTLTQVAWLCHRLRAPDLSYRFFTRVFMEHHESIKFLNAYEADADRAGKLDEVEELYRSMTTEDPRLWGGLKRIEKRRQKNS